MPTIVTHDKDNRTEFKKRLLTQVEAALNPAIPAPSEPVEIEIIERYTKGPWQLEPMEVLTPEYGKEESFVSEREVSKRAELKRDLLNKVEESLLPSPPPLEPTPIEILEKYAYGVPGQLSTDPMGDLPPEFKKAEPTISLEEIIKRLYLKQDLSNKVVESLTPSLPTPEPAPIEILEKYAHGIPGQTFLETEELFPESKETEFAIPLREIPKRAELKRDLLNKVEESLTPSPPPLEPAPIEILERYAHGIPKQSSPLDPDGLILPEARNPSSFILDSSIHGRMDFKRDLLSRVESLIVKAPAILNPIEIMDYSQRAISPYEPEYPEVIKPLKVDDREQVEEAQEAQEAHIAETPVPILRLPSNYKNLDEQALYGLLIRDPLLKHSSESANLTLDILYGRTMEVGEFRIIETELSNEDPFQIETRMDKVSLSDQSNLEWLKEQLRGPIGDKCMVWPFSRDSDNYGALKIESKLWKVHHWVVRNRKRPSGQANLLHKCNNRPCFNPKHLVWGSVSENAVDREASKRGKTAAAIVEPVVAVCPEAQELQVPSNWQEIPPAILRNDLFTMNEGALPSQVDSTLASLYDRPTTKQEPLEFITEEDIIPDLPEDFSTWKSWDQHLYLTKTLKLTPEMAGRVQWMHS